MTDSDLTSAGFTSVESARRALANSYQRRKRLLDQQIDVLAFGGGDFGNRPMEERERSAINRKIVESGGLSELNRRIEDLETLLAPFTDAQ